MAGIVLAVVGVVVLVVAIIALHDPKNPSAAGGGSATVTRTRTAGATPTSSTPTSSPTTSASSVSSSASSTAPDVSQLKSDVPLVVLNNTTITGLAAEAAQRFEQGGWTVSSTGNLVNDIISTCAYYDPSVTDAEAAAKALQRQYPTIQRVEPKFDGLVAGPVVVVLTPDYSND